MIYPNSSYSQAPSLANETILSNRREHTCQKFMAEMTNTRDHPLSCLVSTTVQVTDSFNVRPGSSRPLNTFMRTKRSENFFLLFGIRHLRTYRDYHFKGFLSGIINT